MTDNWMLEAVERLTLPHKSRVLQTNDAGISCISEVDHEPLLKALKDAIGSGVGRHASATQGREKIPLNPAALELFDEIADDVTTWSKHLPTADPSDTLWHRLGKWYVDFENRRRGNQLSLEQEREFEKVIVGWDRRITDMFDPPSVFELTRIVDGHNRPEACPECDQSVAFEPKTGNHITALIVEYREMGPETLDLAVACCRSCGTVWKGRNAIRALRWAIDHPEDKEKSDD